MPATSRSSRSSSSWRTLERRGRTDRSAAGISTRGPPAHGPGSEGDIADDPSASHRHRCRGARHEAVAPGAVVLGPEAEVSQGLVGGLDLLEREIGRHRRRSVGRFTSVGVVAPQEREIRAPELLPGRCRGDPQGCIQIAHGALVPRSTGRRRLSSRRDVETGRWPRPPGGRGRCRGRAVAGAQSQRRAGVGPFGIGPEGGKVRTGHGHLELVIRWCGITPSQVQGAERSSTGERGQALTARCSCCSAPSWRWAPSPSSPPSALSVLWVLIVRSARSAVMAIRRGLDSSATGMTSCSTPST